MDTPSLVIVGAPHFFSRTTLRPFGPSVTLTASARGFIPRSRPRRASSLNAMILGMYASPPRLGCGVRWPDACDGRGVRAANPARSGSTLAGPVICHSQAESASPLLALGLGECKARPATPPAGRDLVRLATRRTVDGREGDGLAVLQRQAAVGSRSPPPVVRGVDRLCP